MPLEEIRLRTAARKRAGIVPNYEVRQVVSVSIKSDLSCAFRGEPTGEVEQCVTCTGKVMLKVFECSVYPQGCTVAKKIDGKACCNGCQYRKPT